MSLSNVIDIKQIDDYLVEKQKESDIEYFDEKRPDRSEDGQTIYFQKP